MLLLEGEAVDGEDFVATVTEDAKDDGKLTKNNNNGSSATFTHTYTHTGERVRQWNGRTKRRCERQSQEGIHSGTGRDTESGSYAGVLEWRCMKKRKRDRGKRTYQ